MNKTFPNPKKIAEYLKTAGYKVNPSTVYKHRDEGRIPAQKDGTFRVEDVDRYAAMHLKRLDGSNASEGMDRLQRDKFEPETMKARARPNTGNQAGPWHSPAVSTFKNTIFISWSGPGIRISTDSGELPGFRLFKRKGIRVFESSLEAT